MKDKKWRLGHVKILKRFLTYMARNNIDRGHPGDRARAYGDYIYSLNPIDLYEEFQYGSDWKMNEVRKLWDRYRNNDQEHKIWHP